MKGMSGTCRPPENSCGTTVLTGQAPVSEMNGYHREVSAYSRGQGRLYCSFCGFLPCHDAEKVIAAKAYDPDRDPENPCGSVFCRHGAGELVPWDEVEDYMDLPLSYEAKNPKSKQVSQRQAGYSDEELEEIFRQTYGLSKREKNRLRKSAKIISADHTSAAYTPVRKAYNDSSAPSVLLIDGYNMIFAWEELKDMAALSLESARDLLLEILNNYQGYTGESVIVVFDAYKQPGNPGTVQSRGSLQVVYTREAETADQYIEKFVLKNVKKLRTSDALEQMMIFGQGALRMSARELRQKILDTNEEIRTKFLGK